MTDSSPNPSDKALSRKPRMWVRVLLALSLGLNLLIAGLAVGAFMRPGGYHSVAMPVGLPLVRAMAPKDRKAIRREVRRMDLPRGEGRGKDLQAVVAGLRSDPFDPGLLKDELDRQSLVRATWQNALREVWLARVATMPPSERAAYAERLEKNAARALKRKERSKP